MREIRCLHCIFCPHPNGHLRPLQNYWRMGGKGGIYTELSGGHMRVLFLCFDWEFLFFAGSCHLEIKCPHFFS